MRRIKKYIQKASAIWILLFLSIGGKMCLAGSQQMSLKNQLDSWGLSLGDIDGFTITDSNQGRFDKVSLNEVTATKQNRVIRVERFNGLTSEEAARQEKEQVYQMQSVFEWKRTPYFAVINKGESCPERFKVGSHEVLDDKKSKRLNYYTLYANERFGYGVCSDKAAFYKMIVTFIYCPKMSYFFKISMFIPRKEFHEKLLANIVKIACQ